MPGWNKTPGCANATQFGKATSPLYLDWKAGVGMGVASVEDLPVTSFDRLQLSCSFPTKCCSSSCLSHANKWLHMPDMCIYIYGFACYLVKGATTTTTTTTTITEPWLFDTTGKLQLQLPVPYPRVRLKPCLSQGPWDTCLRTRISCLSIGLLKSMGCCIWSPVLTDLYSLSNRLLL